MCPHLPSYRISTYIASTVNCTTPIDWEKMIKINLIWVSLHSISIIFFERFITSYYYLSRIVKIKTSKEDFFKIFLFNNHHFHDYILLDTSPITMLILFSYAISPYQTPNYFYPTWNWIFVWPLASVSIS